MSSSPTKRASLLAAAFAMFAATLVLSSTDAEAGRYRSRRYRQARPHGSVGVLIFPRGIYFGAGILATKVVKQDGGPELLDDGAGLNLYAGLRLSQTVALELGWVTTAHNPETTNTRFGPETDYLLLSGVTADAKIFVGTGGPPRLGSAQPFLQGGVGVYVLDSNRLGAESVGTGFQLGGGFDWSVAPNLNLGIRVLYRGIAMGPPESNLDDTFISAVSAEGNLSVSF